MKRSILLISVMVIFAIVPGISASEFDGLNYTLVYRQLTGELALSLDVAGQVMDIEITFDVGENMPSTMINDRIALVCDPQSGYYNPDLCTGMTLLFTQETLDWLDAQWNMHLNSGLAVLPESIQTRQLPWPVNNFGSIYLVDYEIDWPCMWDSAAGDFETIPLSYRFDTPVGETMNLQTSFGLSGVGNVDRNTGYSLGGSFDFETGLVFTGADLLINLQFGLTAEYTN